MRKFYLLLVVFFAVSTLSMGQDSFVKLKTSKTLNETVEKLEFILQENGLTVFSIIDYKKGAEGASMKLEPTTLIIFGSPVVGTKLMHCDQRVGIDLPMKYLVWTDSDGNSWIGYWKPTSLLDKYQLNDCKDALEKMNGTLARFASLAMQ